MPAVVHDVSSTEDRSTTPDVSDNEDTESDYQSCASYILDEGEKHTGEDYAHGGLEILRYIVDSDQWEAIQASEVEDRVGASLTSIEWMSQIESAQWRHELEDRGETSLDALAVLAETVGGPAREAWHRILSCQEKHGSSYYVLELQVLLILIMSGRGACTDTIWWDCSILYIPSQGMDHYSFTCGFFEGRILLDRSPDRPWKDLTEVMRIALPYFREMNTRIEVLSKLQNVGSPSMFGPTNMANLVTCLDIAESVAKLVPVFGNVLEGACGILRKTVQAAENARAARDECRALAEHTASITLAILNEIGPASTLSGADITRICDLRETIKIVDSRVQSLSKLGRLKYIASRGRINAKVMDLRTRVDNARIAFNIRSDISTTRLLTDLKMMQTRLMKSVDDIHAGQKTTHHMLRTILVEVRGRRTSDAYVEEAE